MAAVLTKLRLLPKSQSPFYLTLTLVEEIDLPKFHLLYYIVSSTLQFTYLCTIVVQVSNANVVV